MRLPVVTRPYRSLAIGIMLIWLALGLSVGFSALSGNRNAVSTHQRPQVGWEGFWAGTGIGLMIGAVVTVIAIAGLWLGNQLLRWYEARRARRAQSEGTIAA